MHSGQCLRRLAGGNAGLPLDTSQAMAASMTTLTNEAGLSVDFNTEQKNLLPSTRCHRRFESFLPFTAIDEYSRPVGTGF